MIIQLSSTLSILSLIQRHGQKQITHIPFPEAYSQTARRPAKPLVRAHLRKAVNKAPCHR